ncbi:hypothetical protein Btru_057433 [Bulinus truncatus]|nr:hypothetical protein Btru_057433 [Bulinus truncatus]
MLSGRRQVDRKLHGLVLSDYFSQLWSHIDVRRSSVSDDVCRKCSRLQRVAMTLSGLSLVQRVAMTLSGLGLVQRVAMTLSGLGLVQRVAMTLSGLDYDVPGPHRYDVKFNHLVQPVSKTMGMKRSSKTANTAGPGPAGYNVDLSKMDCPCSFGASVSSRHTPFKFNGVGHKVVLREPPKDIPRVPLLG